MSPDFFWLVLSPLYSVPNSIPPDLPCCRFIENLVVTTSCSCYFLMLFSLSSVTNLSLHFGFCASCMLSYRCLQMEWWATVTVVAIPLQHALLMWPCVSAARVSVVPYLNLLHTSTSYTPPPPTARQCLHHFPGAPAWGLSCNKWESKGHHLWQSGGHDMESRYSWRQRSVGKVR